MARPQALNLRLTEIESIVFALCPSQQIQAPLILDLTSSGLFQLSPAIGTCSKLLTESVAQKCRSSVLFLPGAFQLMHVAVPLESTECSAIVGKHSFRETACPPYLQDRAAMAEVEAMEVDHPIAGSTADAEKKGKGGKSSGRRFEIKKWNAVAMWSWAICTDTCAICRNNLYEPSIEYQVSNKLLF